MADDNTCPTCDGAGTIMDGHRKCPDCGGTGKVDAETKGFLLYDVECRAKYTAAEIEEMGQKGEAFKNSDGSYSYPIGDKSDLANAIHAVGRGNADHDAIRKYIIGRAKALGASDEIPDNWNADGSLNDSKAAGDNTTCNRCGGEGSIKLDSEEIECPQCGGSGDGANNDAKETQSKIHARAELRTELRNVPESRISARSEFELREVPNGTGGTNLRFTGFASVTEAEYEMEDFLGPWVESVSRGAFGKTLNDGADVAFLLNHQGMTLARTKPGTLKLSEVTEGSKSPVFGVTGLHSEAMLDPQNFYVQAMRSAVDRGDLDEMSFAFRVTRQEWSENYDRRWINEVNLNQGDVSLVNYGANPTTGGTVAVRQKLLGRDADEAATPERFVALLKRSAIYRELRAGKAISAANSAELTKALDALHTADDVDIPAIVRSLQDIDKAVDDGLASVSLVLGVKNPDGDAGDLEPELGPPEKMSDDVLLETTEVLAARARLEAFRHAPRRDVA